MSSTRPGPGRRRPRRAPRRRAPWSRARQPHARGERRPAHVIDGAGRRRVRRHAVEGQVRQASAQDRLDGDAVAGPVEELAPARRVDHRHGARRQGHGPRGDLAEQGRELELGPERAETLPVGLPHPEALDVELDRQLALEHRQLARQEGLVAVAREPLAQLRAGDDREVRVEGLEAPELAEELLGGHLPHAGHARDVVDRVAHQREDVGNARRRHAPALLDLGRVVDDALAGPAHDREHRDARADELERVLVRRHQHQLDRGVPEPAGGGGQNVVGLVPGQPRGRAGRAPRTSAGPRGSARRGPSASRAAPACRPRTADAGTSGPARPRRCPCSSADPRAGSSRASWSSRGSRWSAARGTSRGGRSRGRRDRSRTARRRDRSAPARSRVLSRALPSPDDTPRAPSPPPRGAARAALGRSPGPSLARAARAGGPSRADSPPAAPGGGEGTGAAPAGTRRPPGARAPSPPAGCRARRGAPARCGSTASGAPGAGRRGRAGGPG